MKRLALDLRKISKLLHTIGACGLVGGLLCVAVLLMAARDQTPAEYAALRHLIAVISRFVLLPSLALAVCSGLVSMVAHQPFLDKGWVWIKALMGILMFEGVLVVIDGRAREAEAVSARIAENQASPDMLDAAIRMEWQALAVIMFLSLANIVLGIWRPRIVRI